MVMFAIVYASKLVHAFLSFWLLNRYDNVQSNHRFEGVGPASPWQSRMVSRAYAAHLNHWEAFIGFSIAVIMANNNKSREMDQLANLFIIVRVAYNFLYIIANDDRLAFVRSAIWTVGVLIIFRIFSLGVTVTRNGTWF